MDKRRRAACEPQLILEFFGGRTDGFFVDIGANDPKRGSVSYSLEQAGWDGILVEPLPEFAKRLRAERRARVFQVACGSPDQRGHATFSRAEEPCHSGFAPEWHNPGARVVAEFEVQVRTIDDLLDEVGCDAPSLVSIDVEGTEIDVLEGLDLLRLKPSLLLVEDGLENLRKHRYVRSRGYRLVRRTGFNNWYVPRDSPLRTLGAIGERWELLRKVFLATPFRRVKRFRQLYRRRKELRAER